MMIVVALLRELCMSNSHVERVPLGHEVGSSRPYHAAQFRNYSLLT